MTPSRPAITFAGRTLTAAELAARAESLAGRLTAAGIAPGDRVVTLLANSAAPVVLIHACRIVGAVVVPLNPRWSAAEVAEPAARVRPRLAVVDAGDERDTVAAVVDAASGGIVAVDSIGGDPSDGGSGARPDTSNAPIAWPWPPPDDPDRAQAIVFTSGTTGAPRGAVLSWGNDHANWVGSRARLGHGADDVWLVALPLHHVGGLAIVLRAAWDGAHVVVLPRFDADAVARAIAEHGVTRLSLVPTSLGAVLDAWAARRGTGGARTAPSTLRTVLLGGGPLVGAPVARAVELGFPLALTYGLTEAASQVATTAPGWTPGEPAAAPPLDGVRVRIAAGVGDAMEVGTGGVGEIEVAGPTVFAGYWDDPAATAAALSGGWLRTGDLGHLDGAGRLTVVGRADDRITTGGESVDPAEVEAVIDGHPAVGASCVVGMADPVWGQVVVAVIEPAREGDVRALPDVDALRGWLDGRLANYKRPRRVVAVAALPRTAAGKMARAAVRRLAELDLDAADSAGDDVVDERLDGADDEAHDTVHDRQDNDRADAEDHAEQAGSGLVAHPGGHAGAEDREERDEGPRDQADHGHQGTVHLGAGKDVDPSDGGHGGGLLVRAPSG
ncbi:MAG: AMP-binding protein [Ardenticatenales bacterium]|nr:AMP-binding protein [Ardenticatenales bacterium]